MAVRHECFSLKYHIDIACRFCLRHYLYKFPLKNLITNLSMTSYFRYCLHKVIKEVSRVDGPWCICSKLMFMF